MGASASFLSTSERTVASRLSEDVIETMPPKTKRELENYRKIYLNAYTENGGKAAEDNIESVFAVPITDPSRVAAYKILCTAYNMNQREKQIEEVEVVLKALESAIDATVFVGQRWPFIIDGTGQVATFFRYQGGCLLDSTNPRDMEPENLRKALVACLRYGKTLCINFGTVKRLELSQFFSQGFFPSAIFDREILYRDEVIQSLLRPDSGDPTFEKFVPQNDFKFVCLCSAEEAPKRTAARMAIIRVRNDVPRRRGRESEAARSELAGAFGLKEMKRNSKELVDAAFNGDLAEVQNFVAKGYHIDSENKLGHTAISEASCAGKIDIVEWLIEQGANTNTFCKKQNRTPLFRAAFHGHSDICELLLCSGADPDLKTNGTVPEKPQDIAKTKELQSKLSAWDRKVTIELRRQRESEIQRKLEERIKDKHKLNAIARNKIQQELVELAEIGDVLKVTEYLENLATEAEENNERVPMGSAMARDYRGNTLLSIASQHGRIELVKKFVTHWKTELKESDSFFDIDENEMKRRVWRVDVNSRDTKGWSPIMIAAFHSKKKIVELLLDHGGNPKLRNSYGKNTFEVTKSEEIKQILRTWGEKNGWTDLNTIDKEQLESDISKKAKEIMNPKKKKKRGKGRLKKKSSKLR